ncbi:MAG TPA: hypothetical protein VGK17_14085 [Propionicimonas sp.]|jgi:hypothetical protein
MITNGVGKAFLLKTPMAAAVLALAVASGAARVAGAAEQRPLPAFQVVSLDGAATPSDQIGVAGQWLVIYVTPTSAASARLLAAMKAWDSPAMARRVVVVVGAPLPATQAFVAQRSSDIPGVRWFADPQGGAWKALRLTGTPYLLGVRDGGIKWSLAGVLNDPKTLESVIRTWIEPKRP